MKRIFCLVLLLCSAPVVTRAADCPPQGYSREQLLELRGGGFVMENEAERDALAVALLDCLSDPDPAIRDGVVFEGLTAWMRAGQLSPGTLEKLYTGLLTQLGDSGDEAGFQQPFAALVLSELTRTDRIEPWMTPAMRAELVAVSAAYLSGILDYRGFSETEGWRHGVAHGSDLVLQLVLNPGVGAEQIEMLINAVAIQVAPPGAVFYIYGEPGRLARAVFYAYTRGVLDEDAWKAWFERISSPTPLEDWSAAFGSQAGLAKRHNTLGFLMAMHMNAGFSEGEQADALDALVMQATTRVLGG